MNFTRFFNDYDFSAAIYTHRRALVHDGRAENLWLEILCSPIPTRQSD